MKSPLLTLLLAGLAAAGIAGPAAAHLDPIAHGSFAAGLSHPLTGLDHVLAMVTVGVWAALVGGRAVWAVPTAFVATMLAGFAIALAGIEVPGVEPAVLASIVVLGGLTAMALPVPAGVGAAVVGAFALFHGAAHGAEIGAAGALPYAAGFAMATTIFHIIGIVICLALAAGLGTRGGRYAARIAGGAVALGGLALALAQ